jgi:hypothetical protein
VNEQLMKCPACSYMWVDGLPGERRKHAGFHAAYMRPRRPKPDPRLAAYAGDEAAMHEGELE